MRGPRARLCTMSLTRISAFPVPARSRDRALPVSPPKWRSHVSVLCSGSRCRAERASLLAVGADISAVWTTSARDRKELLRTLLEEVIIKIERDKLAAHLTMRWKGGALTELNLYVPRFKPQIVRTDEDTIALVRRLATHYPDGVVAGILNRQGRKTAYGHRFQAHHVTNLRQRS